MIQFTNLILFVSRKHILILLFRLMMTIWKFPSILWIILPIVLIQNIQVSASTTKTAYHYEFYLSVNWTNVWFSSYKPWYFLNVFGLFSHLKRKLSNFSSCVIFIFNEKEASSCQFFTSWQKGISIYDVTSKSDDFFNFHFVIMQLYISLPHQHTATQKNTAKFLTKTFLG